MASNKVIIFSEPGEERILPAGTLDELATSCLLILRERYTNTIWGYQPKHTSLSNEEEDFISFWESESNVLPRLLKKHGQRIYDRLKDASADADDPDWIWYRSVEELLALPPDIAKGYRVGYGGRIIPTSYYLLLKRKENPNEGFVLAELQKQK